MLCPFAKGVANFATDKRASASMYKIQVHLKEIVHVAQDYMYEILRLVLEPDNGLLLSREHERDYQTNR